VKVLKKKSLGQNFLHDKGVIRSIVDASSAQKGDFVVEIGPGDGSLTKEMLSRGFITQGIELDKRMIEILEETFPEEIQKGHLILTHADILEWEPGEKDYHIVANIPYYITGAILRKFLEGEHKPQSMTLVMQKEVAERIIEKDGKGSILSKSVQVFGEPRLVKTIKSGAFNPPPDVESAVLVVENIKDCFDTKEQKEDFFLLLKKGFAHKRKKLYSNIKDLVSPSVFGDLGFSPQVRAEELSTEEWLLLSRSVDR
jgi:16S rRNA (adenine1518-N6/adenine1519-N6)-dimethyltransferase